jgi:Flp pilus assembly protein CpaB
MFALIIAVLLGLGVTVAAKQAGLFDKPPAEVKKEEPIMVLVANDNLFEATTLSPKNVRIRELKPSERAAYLANPDKYLPARVEAANFRVLARSVPADDPLLKEHFNDLALPGKYTDLISPYMRAVDVALPRERAGAGLLRVGEHVDVLLTASICDSPECKNPITRTAVIARDLKIIVKRNSLFTFMQSDPENALISYTLEANPYRRALIEYAKQKGMLSLAPAPGGELRGPVVSTPGGIPSFSDPGSKEYRDEDARVASVLRGDLSVGDEDLERLFDLKVKPPAPPPTPPVSIQVVSGVRSQGFMVFPPNSDRDGVMETSEPPMAGQRTSAAPAGNGGAYSASPGGYRFLAPPKEGCPTCGKKKNDFNQK